MIAGAFDPVELLRVLAEHSVEFVVIGGLAARAHGSPLITNDLDICYSRDDANLERVARALQDLDARLRGVEDEVPFRLDAATLRAGDAFTFTTRAGALDIIATPPGSGGFDELARTARVVELAGSEVRIASLDDLMSMKRSAGRPKDLAILEELAALRDRRDERNAR